MGKDHAMAQAAHGWLRHRRQEPGEPVIAHPVDGPASRLARDARGHAPFRRAARAIEAALAEAISARPSPAMSAARSEPWARARKIAKLIAR